MTIFTWKEVQSIQSMSPAPRMLCFTDESARSKACPTGNDDDEEGDDDGDDKGPMLKCCCRYSKWLVRGVGKTPSCLSPSPPPLPSPSPPLSSTTRWIESLFAPYNCLLGAYPIWNLLAVAGLMLLLLRKLLAVAAPSLLSSVRRTV